MLTLENLSTIQAKSPLRDLNARFEAGRIYTILGRTGAGKTELLRTLIGLDAVASGTIKLDGTDLSHVPIRNREMAMVYQQFINYPHLSVLDNVAFPLRRQGVGRAEAASRAEEALQLVGLADFADRRPLALSGGQQQRVALARAIVKKARILLMDEPLANLDYKLREQLREEFPKLLHDSVGGVILYTTTEPAEAIQLGDRMIVMHEGRIVAEGDPTALFDAPPTVDVARVVSDPPISIFTGTAGPGEVYLAGGVTAPLPGLKMPPGKSLQVGIRPDGLRIGGAIPARISLSEFSGSDTIVHLHLPFGDAVMLLEGIHEMHSGTELGVATDPARLLIFREDGTYHSGGPA